MKTSHKHLIFPTDLKLSEEYMLSQVEIAEDRRVDLDVIRKEVEKRQKLLRIGRRAAAEIVLAVLDEDIRRAKIIKAE